jgi:AcrR family transcriptional regulator
MRLSAEDRRQQLINAATELFSDKGFDATSTREIAVAAGINEALIFRYFTSKEDLFWAVLSKKLDGLGRRKRIRQLIDLQLDPRQTLVAIAEMMLVRNAEDMALSRLLLFGALRSGELSDRLFRNYMSGVFESLSDFFRTGAENGSFKQGLDPSITARAFLGMLVYHNWVQEIMGGSRYETFDSQETAAQLVDLLLGGISPENGTEKKRSSRQRVRPVMAELEAD